MNVKDYSGVLQGRVFDVLSVESSVMKSVKICSTQTVFKVSLSFLYLSFFLIFFVFICLRVYFLTFDDQEDCVQVTVQGVNIVERERR